MSCDNIVYKKNHDRMIPSMTIVSQTLTPHSQSSKCQVPTFYWSRLTQSGMDSRLIYLPPNMSGSWAPVHLHLANVSEEHLNCFPLQFDLQSTPKPVYKPYIPASLLKLSSISLLTLSRIGFMCLHLFLTYLTFSHNNLRLEKGGVQGTGKIYIFP